MQAANHYENLPGFNEFMEFVMNSDSEYKCGVKLKGGPRSIFQMAGGESSVIKRLGFTAYTTHLGVTIDTNSNTKLNPTLSSVR